MIKEGEGDMQVASPFSRLLHTTNFNLSIIVVMGFNGVLELSIVKDIAAKSLLKHPRFSSLLVLDDPKRYKMSWNPTKVKIDEHVFAPDLNTEVESTQGDKLVDDFISTISHIPMDYSKPLWELHILNVKTSNSTSTAVFKIHHSVGDGVSLMSVVLACGRKISDPEALPSLPISVRSQRNTTNKRVVLVAMFIWRMLLIFYFTVMELLEFIATIFFLKDSDTPIKAGQGIENSPKRYVHCVLDFEDVKLIKNSMETTVSDVFFGITQAALSRYLERRHEKNMYKEDHGVKKKTKNPLKKLRIRALIPFNLRPPPTVQETYEIMQEGKKMEELKTWGNIVSFVIIPMKMCIKEDPLSYIRDAKAVMDRKKLSCLSLIEFYIVRFIIYLLGVNFTAFLLNMFISHITFGISSVVGPKDEIAFFGHQLSYIAPTVTGFPMSMVIHFQSYANKIIVSLAIDETLIPDPHQLCNDFQYTLQIIKEAVLKKIAAETTSIPEIVIQPNSGEIQL